MNLINDNQKMLIELVSAGIRNKPFNVDFNVLENGFGVDWAKLLDEAIRHQVVTIVYKPLAENSDKLHIPGELLEKFRIYTLYEGMEQERNYAIIGIVLDKLTAAGIQVIALKGLVIRELYPYPYLRPMCDFDLLVRQDDMCEVCRIIEESGFKLDVDDGKEVKYVHEIYGCIDLHRKLVPIGERFKKMAGFEEHVWENAITVNVSGSEVLALCPLDCAVFLLIHMASHVISSGFGLRQLCDFYLVVERYIKDIDWKEFLKETAAYHVNIFAIAVLKICQLFFGLELPDGCVEAVEKFSDDELLENFIEDIFDSGASGKTSSERINANRMLYYSRKKSAKAFQGKFSMYIQLLFPAADKLAKRYGYAKKCFLLLPVAWLHRFIYCLVRKDISFREKTSAFSSLKSAEICKKRGELLRGLGLL